jgi:hypothetical protein
MRTVGTSGMKILKISLLLGTILPALLPAQGVYPYSRSRRVAPGTPVPSAYNVAGSFHGKLKDLTSKEIMIETDDNQTVSIRRSRKTKFLKGKDPIKASDIDLETLVTVDAGEDPDLKLTAVDVIVDPPPKSPDSNAKNADSK